MTALLAALLILVPSPKAAPAPQHWVIGAQSIDWNSCRQTTFFFADGTCSSPEFGLGTWVDVDGAIYFTEQGGKNHYTMTIENGEGVGHSVGENGYGPAVEVKIRRGEYLHNIPPREVN